MPKFSFEKFLNSQQNKVFDIATDFKNYQTNFPNTFPSVRVLSTRNNVSVVEEHMMLGEKELVMMTKHVVNKPDTHDIFVIGGDAKGTHILETFEAFENGTKMKILVDFKLKGTMKISNLLNKKTIENDYSKIVDEFVRVVEI
ncbi:polyketide cyclase [Nitrosopumilus sp. K4]|uniref:polyketide cyclase n=1 Tax=Nitrosopumilus sp. K4 TaxID=2795383 RepID=UPI001BA95A2B|nr:polyketide cyclase [Nitrosopumilus sp. K4]QUC65353.1 polyketide cyclase [Nitrosopumilus sp. K4]